MSGYSNVSSLYQKVILEHNKAPKNYGVIIEPTVTLSAYSEACGDKYDIYLKITDNVIVDIKFQGSGCALSKASTSIMTELLMCKSLADVEIPLKDPFEIPSFSEIFSAVLSYPARLQCVTLAWKTLRDGNLRSLICSKDL